MPKNVHIFPAENASTEAEALLNHLFRFSNLPSEAHNAYWIHAKPVARFYSTEHSGKWCVFRSCADIDAAWNLVNAAVTRGELAFAKVSTALGADRHDNNYVICAYTRDYRDEEDLARSRAVLRGLGFTEELGYKRDEDTRNNVYGKHEWYRRSI